MIGLFVVGVLRPDAEITEMKSMVTPKHDDGVVFEAQLLQSKQDLADLCIDVTDTGVIAVDELAGEVVVDGSGITFVGDREIISEQIFV